MDVIVTAIIIGFLAWMPIKFIAMFWKNYTIFKKLEIAKRIVDSTMMVRIDEVKYEDNESLILVFNAVNDQFITQGTNKEVCEYIFNKFKTKNIFLVAADGSATQMLKPAESE